MSILCILILGTGLTVPRGRLHLRGFSILLGCGFSGWGKRYRIQKASMKSYVVEGIKGTKRIVTLYPKESCSCPSTGPGPGRYALPPTLGLKEHDFTKTMQPAYSFGRRLIQKSQRDGPGPAYFVNSRMTRFGRDGTPSYSLAYRPSDKSTFQTPSPFVYSPEKVHPQREKTAPKYTMGSRTRYRKLDQNPSSNNYKLPSVLGENQSYKASPVSCSIKGYSHIGSYLEDLAKTPGPGHTDMVENEIYMNRAPRYTLRSREFMPGDNVKKPGPGAHYPENVKVNRRKAPTYSLGVRHSEFTCPFIA